MTFFDQSPGAGIAVANAILYATVLTETWMLTTGSLAVMGLIMVLIIVLAGLLCRYMMHLMGTEEYISGEAAVAPAPARTTAGAVAPATAPAPAIKVAAAL